MIIQLANGRIIEISTEQYLSLSDEEIRDLEGLSSHYTKEVGNPFYHMFHKGRNAAELDMLNEEEYEPQLDEITAAEKMDDPYFRADDI
tara:strand:+ start:247 stop:513 length:267 start_codon:yes stop_codon:yes gene_type:complete